MKKETVWRLQNESGSGPYIGPGNVIEVLRAISNAGRFNEADRPPNAPAPPVSRCAMRRPPPWMDEGLKEKFNSRAGLNPKTRCAFRTIEQYNNWFNTRELRDFLHYAGFFLAKYEVKGTVWHGQKQSLFFPHQAKLIAVRACNDSGVTSATASTLKAAKRFLLSEKKRQPANSPLSRD